LSKTLFTVGPIMDMNERQIALSVLESLREGLTYAHLKNGTRILDVADLRQYIYEMMGRIRTTALAMLTYTATTTATGKISARVMVTIRMRIHRKNGESNQRSTDAAIYEMSFGLRPAERC
jgi:hypothetical protein